MSGINVRIRGDKVLESYLAKLPRGTIRDGLKAFTTYILGNSSHGLRHDDPYKYVSRAKAYGMVSNDGAPAGYFSMKQFRFVMAKIASGEITPGQPNRSGAASAAWEMKETNNGYGYSAINADRGAYYTRSDKGQARQPALVGWRKTAKVIADNFDGAMRALHAAVDAVIAKKG